MPDRIAALARRLEDDPFFLAAALHEYARSEGFDEVRLAAHLGCPVETLSRLGLCRRPRPEPPHFRRDVDQIAARFEVSADVLAQIVRRADALVALRPTTEDRRGTLRAARDREEQGRASTGGERPEGEAP